MSLLNLATGEYPVSVQHVRDANPNVSFPAVPTDADLSPFGYANVRPTPRPSIDPRTQRVEGPSAEPDGAGGYRELWTLREATPAEIAEWDHLNPPEPEWTRFKMSIWQSPESRALLELLRVNSPENAAALVPTLLNASIGTNESDFFAIWGALKAGGVISPSLSAFVHDLSIDCHLPSRFLELFEP